MCIGSDDWKKAYRRSLEASIKSFGNSEKFEREKWVVRRLLGSLRVDFDESNFFEIDEPADVGVFDAAFQVKELMENERRRGDEFKHQLEVLDAAESLSDLSKRCESTSITFCRIVELVDEKAETLGKEKYGPAERQSMDLLCYFNFLDYFIVPPLTFAKIGGRGFRSISIVTNHYCSVLYANQQAPEFLRANVERVVEYVVL